MKKKEIYEGVIEGIDFPDKGYLHIEGRKVTVKYGLTGQRVRFCVTKLRKGAAQARLLEVMEPSPVERPKLACPHAGICGGCIYQTFPYEEQLRIKEEQVRRLLEPVMRQYEKEMDGAGQNNFHCEGIVPSPMAEGYRNKMEFSFGDSVKDGPLELGMHKRGSFHDIVTVSGCRIVHPDFRKILLAVLEFCREKELPFYRKLTHTGYLRHLLVRRSVRTGQLLVCLVTSSQYPGRGKEEDNEKAEKAEEGGTGENTGGSESAGAAGEAGGTGGEADRSSAEAGNEGTDRSKWTDRSGQPDQEQFRSDERELLEEFVRCIRDVDCEAELAGILHIVNDSLADVVQSDRTEILYGQDYFYEELLGLRFKITPFSFFQTNSLGAEVLYQTVRDYVSQDREGRKDQTVFDLYSGTGTIAQLLAPAAGQVIGVEIVEEAVEAARQNAAANGLENCRFIAGDVLKVLDEIEEKPDFIVLDPPREGIHPKALPKIIGYGVERLVYISCKPTSLARDLEMLLAAGYEVERWKMVDMFPGTGNVETVCLLSNRKPDNTVKIGIGMEDYRRIRDEEKAE